MHIGVRTALNVPADNITYDSTIGNALLDVHQYVESVPEVLYHDFYLDSRYSSIRGDTGVISLTVKLEMKSPGNSFFQKALYIAIGWAPNKSDTWHGIVQSTFIANLDSLKLIWIIGIQCTYQLTELDPGFLRVQIQTASTYVVNNWPTYNYSYELAIMSLLPLLFSPVTSADSPRESRTQKILRRVRRFIATRIGLASRGRETVSPQL